MFKNIYLSVNIYLKDGGRVNRVVGPFGSPDDSIVWQREIGRAQLASPSRNLKWIEIFSLDQAPLMSHQPIAATRFLEEVLGEYQDTGIFARCLLRFGDYLGLG